MAVDIKLRRSSVPGKVPTTASLELGELAVNTYDGKVYMKKQVGNVQSIVEIGSGSGGGGGVTNVSVVSANGFAGSVANPTTTPAITVSTTVVGIMKGNGTAASAAVAGTDYITPTQGTASWALNAINAITASYFSGSIANAITASYALTATSASYASSSTSASYANTSVSASYANNATSASYANNATSASYAQNATTASYALNATSASYAVSAAYAPPPVSVSYAETASYAGNFTVAGTITAQTLVVQVITSSQELITGSLIVSGSLNAYGGVTGSLLGTASWANNVISASYALTSSNVQGGIATYVPLWNTNTSLTSSYLNQSGNVLKTTYGVDKGLTLDFNYDSYILGNPGTGNNTYLQVFDGGGVLNIYSPSYTYFNDKVGIRIFPTNPGLAVSGSLEITGPGNSKFVNSNVDITGSLNVTNGITGSLFGTASWANNVISASYTLFSTSASYASASTSASYALTSSYSIYAQTASYANNIYISGSISNVDYIDFDTSMSYTLAEGRLGWDNGEGTLQLGLAGGNTTYFVGEQMYQYCYNAETSSLTKGQAVYVSGSQGNRIAVKLASNTNDANSAGTLGLVAETIIAGGQGWIQTEGPLRKLNTIGLTPGALVYLGNTPGTYTTTKPIAPLHEVRIGYVERVHASVGSIYIKIDNGYEIGELHDVVDSTTTSSYGDLFIKSGSLWINSRQLTGSYGLTGSLIATSGGFTGSLLGTASYATNALSASYSLFATSASYASASTSASYASASTSASYAATSSYTPSINGTTNYVAKFTSGNTIGNSIIYDDGSSVGIGTTVSSYILDVNGTGRFTSIIETSTRTLKDNIQPYTTNTELFNQLTPVSFTWKDTGKQDVGLIAEDVEKLFPEFVSKTEQGDVTGINYGKLVTVLINVLKDQQHQINDLKYLLQTQNK